MTSVPTSGPSVSRGWRRKAGAPLLATPESVQFLFPLTHQPPAPPGAPASAPSGACPEVCGLSLPPADKDRALVLRISQQGCVFQGLQLFFKGKSNSQEKYITSSAQICRSVMSDSLRPHELQHARPPCPHQLLELTQTHDHRVSDAIQPSPPLLSPSPPAFNLSQHQGLFK